MKNLSKCKECMKIAEEQHKIRKLSKGYLYQLLRENCTHQVAEDKQ